MAHPHERGVVGRPQEEVPSGSLQIVGFRIGEEEYAIEILRVVGVERLESVLQFPQMPVFVEGVKRIRGEIVPLVKLRTRFGLPDYAADDQTRVIVVEIEDETIGFIVDAVTKVRRLTWADVEPSPQSALTIASRFVQGVVHLEDRMLILMVPEMVLQDDEAAELSSTKAAGESFAAAGG